MAQTGDETSALAARYIGITPDELFAITATGRLRRQTVAELRSMAASLLRQDETRGLRRFLKRMLGK